MGFAERTHNPLHRFGFTYLSSQSPQMHKPVHSAEAIPYHIRNGTPAAIAHFAGQVLRDAHHLALFRCRHPFHLGPFFLLSCYLYICVLI